jgi:hypothetical protein
MTTIDFRTLPLNIPSLCIPRVFNNITEERIRNILNELKLGDIERIDIVSKSGPKNNNINYNSNNNNSNNNNSNNNNSNNNANDKFNMVFIHFSQWYLEGNSLIARERLLSGKEIKILYDDPWFWKISAYKMPIKIAPYKNNKINNSSIKMQFDSDEENQDNKLLEKKRQNNEMQKQKQNKYNNPNPNPNPNFNNKFNNNNFNNNFNNNTNYKNKNNNKIRRDHNTVAISDEFGRNIPRIEKTHMPLNVIEEIDDIPEFNDIIHTLTPPTSPHHNNDNIRDADPDNIPIKPLLLDYGNLPIPPKRKARATKKNENLIKLCIEEEDQIEQV